MYENNYNKLLISWISWALLLIFPFVLVFVQPGLLEGKSSISDQGLSSCTFLICQLLGKSVFYTVNSEWAIALGRYCYFFEKCSDIPFATFSLTLNTGILDFRKSFSRELFRKEFLSYLKCDNHVGIVNYLDENNDINWNVMYHRVFGGQNHR